MQSSCDLALDEIMRELRVIDERINRTDKVLDAAVIVLAVLWLTFIVHSLASWLA